MGKGGAKKASAKVLAAAKKQTELDKLRSTPAIIDEHYKPLAQLQIDLSTHRETGLLSVEDVRLHQKRFGKNEIPHPKTKSIVVKILEEQFGGFSLVMYLAAACHLWSGYYLADQEYIYAGVVMILMSIVTAAFLFVENNRVRPDHKPQYEVEQEEYVVRRHEFERRIKAKDIVVGDIILNLHHGQLIPADCRILACDHHTCVNNILFGYGAAELRVSEDDGGYLGAEPNPMDAENMIWRGSDITNKGIIQEAMVLKVGKQTQVGRTLKLMHALEEKADHQSFTRKEIGAAAMAFSVTAIIIMIISMIYMSLLPAPLPSTDMVIVAASVLLSCIPMGLLLSTMLTLRTSYSRMLVKGVNVKDIGSIEVMGGVSAIVTQPQGPLSNGHEIVAALVYLNDDGELHMTFPPSPYDKYTHTEEYAAAECQARGQQHLQKSALLACHEARYVTKEEDVNHTRWPAETHPHKKHLVPLHPYELKRDEVTGKRHRSFRWATRGEESDCAAIRFYHEHKAGFQIVHDETSTVGSDGVEHTHSMKVEADPVDVRDYYPKIFWSPYEPKRGFEIFIRCSGPGKDPTTNNSPRVVYIKGNPESVIARCTKFRDPAGPSGVHGLRPMSDADRKVLDDTIKRYSSEGLKVIAFAESEPLPLSNYSHNYKYMVNPAPTDKYTTGNFPLGEDSEAPNVHPRSVGGLIFNGLICTHDEVHDLEEAMSLCRQGDVRVIMTTPENAEHGLGLARKVGIVTEENTDLDLMEHNEIIRNLVGTDPAIGEHNYAEENRRLESLPQEQQDHVAHAMSDYLTMPVEEIIAKGYNKLIDPDYSTAAIVTADRVYNERTKQYADLEDMDSEWWERMFRNKPEVVIARCRPIHRQLVCLNLQRLDYTVALTGMGPEDAIALQDADIGITTPEASTMVQSAADVILTGGHFAGIVELIKEGRLVYENLKKTTAFLTVSNVPQMMGIFAHVWLQLPLPINATLVLLVDLVTNMIPSIAMAGEPPEKPLMLQPPRKLKTEPIITFKMIFFSYFQIGVIQAFAGMYAYFVVMADYGFSPAHLYEGGPKGNWGNAPLYCKFDGGKYVNTRGEIDTERNPTTQRPTHLYPLWDGSDGGSVMECVHPIRNYAGGGHFSLTASPINIGLASSYYHHGGAKTTGRSMITVETLDALEYNGFYEYIPFKARMSAFWKDDWLSYDITQSRESLSSNQIPYRNEEEEEHHRDKRIQGQDVLRYYQKPSLGLWSICLDDPLMEPAHKLEPEATSPYEEDGLKGFATWMFTASGNNGKEKDPDATSGKRKSLWGWYVGDGGRHPATPYEQLPKMAYNASAVGSTGCRRETIHDLSAETGSLYTHALFCNGDGYRVEKQFYKKGKPGVDPEKSWLRERLSWKAWGDGHKFHDDLFATEKPGMNESVLREKCAVLDNHHHQLAYCKTECHYECPRVPPEGRFNVTGFQEDTIKNPRQKKSDNPGAGWEVYGEGRTCQCANIASRMVQTEALYNARTAFLVAIVFCQIATVISFKTRWLSVVEHGLGNPLLNVGLFASLMAMALATYSPMLNDLLSTRPIRFFHWMPGLPWACVIIVYDEARKFFMRNTSRRTTNENGEQERVIGWLESNTHY
mmetsp:Transcript_63044/g.172985  ORF Transcript_63044/g.172985 Transcript_63044/m.172985 type:complete len:1610 (+) Transcript_63044:203-5032(+)